MMSVTNLNQSLSLEGLNLECGKSKSSEKEESRELNSSYFCENAPPLSVLKDLEENNRQTALRRATLLKQRMISTELKVDGLKKLHPEPVYEIPANKLYYQTQLDKLNIKLDNYTEAFHKYHEQRRQSLSDSVGRFTEKDLKNEDYYVHIAVDTSEGNKCKSALRMIGSFLDTKLRGHKRTKSADIKSHEFIDHFRPRSISSINADHISADNQLLQVPIRKEMLRTKVDANALREIEAFEKFIKEYLENHREEYFF